MLTMADPRARPGFGQLDFDVDAPDAGAPLSGFGEIDLPLVNADPSPPSSDRARAVVDSLPGGNDATRILTGDPLAELAEAELAAAERAQGIFEPPPSDSGIATRDPRVAEMRERYVRGDARGALELAERISSAPPPPLDRDLVPRSVRPVANERHDGVDPFDAAFNESDFSESDFSENDFSENDFSENEKSETRQRRDVLAQLGSRRPTPPKAVLLTLTARQAIPRVLVGQSELALLPIDHRAGFLLAHMDGIHTMEEILDICAMPPEEALALIRELEALGVIRIE